MTRDVCVCKLTCLFLNKLTSVFLPPSVVFVHSFPCLQSLILSFSQTHLCVSHPVTCVLLKKCLFHGCSSHFPAVIPSASSCVCLYGHESTYRRAVASIHTGVLFPVCGPRGDQQCPDDRHTRLGCKAFVPAAQFKHPVSSYHNRYRAEPPCYLHPSIAGHSTV